MLAGRRPSVPPREVRRRRHGAVESRDRPGVPCQRRSAHAVHNPRSQQQQQHGVVRAVIGGEQSQAHHALTASSAPRSVFTRRVSRTTRSRGQAAPVQISPMRTTGLAIQKPSDGFQRSDLRDHGQRSRLVALIDAPSEVSGETAWRDRRGSACPVSPWRPSRPQSTQ